MAFYITLVAFTFIFSTDSKVDALQLYSVGKPRVQRIDSHVQLRGLTQPLRKCYRYNLRVSCHTNFKDTYSWGNIDTRKYDDVNWNPQRRVFDSLARVDLETSGRLNRPIDSTAKRLNLIKLNTKSSFNHTQSPAGSFINGSIPEVTVTDVSVTVHQDDLTQNRIKQDKNLNTSFDEFERNLYTINFNKFLDITSASKGDSGMSFVQSGLFLEMALMAISTEVGDVAKNEINKSVGLNLTDEETIELIKQTIGSLPRSGHDLIFRWSTRLVLCSGRQLSEKFHKGAAKALHLKIGYFEGELEPEAKAAFLNSMIEMDSDGAIRETFEEEDLIGDVQAVLISTLYFRASWRSAPTLLNGTWEFHDDPAPAKRVRMIRVNDIMKYTDLPEWDAEAIEIPYLTRGLNLLILLPRSNSLRHLVNNATNSNLESVIESMKDVRIAVTLPLYTLRMTLLLPNKLEAMGIWRLLDASGTPPAPGELRVTHAVQRLMFWAEAGRNAFKDDGLEWDEPPEYEITVNKPYMFFVRWQKMTLMRGNFVL